jgi:tetratricopeptide (TPR) repeat protein
MYRFTIATLFACSAGLGAVATARAQTAQSPDRVIFLDSLKREAKSGKIIEETPAQITMEGNVRIAMTEVKDVTYVGRLAPTRRASYTGAIKAEEAIDRAAAGPARRTALEAAIKAYRDALPDVKGIAFARRQFDYKVAVLTATLAGDDGSQRNTAIELLTKFLKEHGDGWQIVRAARTLADLQVADEDYQGASGTLKGLLGTKGLLGDMNAAITRQLIEVLLNARDYQQAAALIDKTLAQTKADSAAAFSLRLLKFQADGSMTGQLDRVVKQIDGLIVATRDRRQLADCYNTKANLLLANGQPKEALYEFLFVDLIYGDEGSEQAKACAELSRLFDKIKQPARAREYADKALRLRP